MPNLITLEDKVCVCELNRPHAMNSIDPEMREELFAFYERMKSDNDIHVIIFTGAGDKAFCTGADLKKTMPDTNVSYAQQLLGEGDPGSAFKGLETDKPIICAVNGYALAGGTELLCACDIAIASENAKFGLSEVKRGSIPWGGSIQRLPHSISKSDAMLLLLTGDVIDAQEALRMGLVSKVVPHKELMPTAIELGRRIAKNAPLAVRAIKQLVTRGQDMPLVHALQVDKYMYGLLKTRAVALETLNQGITCNAICPGSVLTPNVETRVLALMQERGLERDAAVRIFLAGKQPIQRFVESEHVADLLVFLCGPAGRDITGAMLPVEGGLLAS